MHGMQPIRVAVGNLEKFAVKDVDGNVIGYDYRGKPDGNDAYIFPTSGIMAEAPSDMDQESEIDEDEGDDLSRRFRANGGSTNNISLEEAKNQLKKIQE